MLQEDFDLFLVLVGSFVVMHVAFFFFWFNLALLRFCGLRMCEPTFKWSLLRIFQNCNSCVCAFFYSCIVFPMTNLIIVDFNEKLNGFGGLIVAV